MKLSRPQDCFKWLISLILTLQVSSLLGQWQTIAQNTQVKDGVFFVSPTVGFGIYGQGILRTDDGGYTWVNQSQQQGTSWGGDDIVFTDNGAFGIIVNNITVAPNDYYFTTDSGKTWQNPFSLFNKKVRQVQFTNRDTGYVVSHHGVEPGELYQTVDGSSNWTTIYKGGADTRLAEIRFVNGRIGYVGGFVNDTLPTIFRTYDAGTTWDSITVSENLQYPMVFEVIDEATAFITSPFTKKVYKSVDSCKSWSQVFFNDSLWVRHIKFPSKDTGYFGAFNVASAKDVIYRTTNGGQSWHAQTFPGFAIGDLFFLNAAQGWAIGSSSGDVAKLSGNIGISERSSIDVSVYPNPTQGDFTIDMGVVYSSARLQLTNLEGKLVFEQELAGAQKFLIQIKQPPGAYFLNISIKGGIAHREKVIVQ